MARHGKPRATDKGPEPAQLRAIERLLADKRFDEAFERSTRLAAAYPAHTGVRGLHIESMLVSGRVDAAAQLAREWMELHPNSTRAARLSAIACLEAGLPNLALAAVVQLAALGEPDAELESDTLAAAKEARSRMGDVDLATVLRVEQGLLFCFLGQDAEASEMLDGIDVPAARYALALRRFNRLDVQGALDTIWPVVERPAPFPAALFTAALYSLYLGERERLDILVDRMIEAVPADPEHLLHQLAGLLLLDHAADAVRAFERAPADAREGGDADTVARMWNAAGVAYARAGDWTRARPLFQRALDADPDHVYAETNLEAAQDRESGEAPVVLGVQDWLPEPSARTVVEAITDLIDQDLDIRTDTELLDMAPLPERSSYLAVLARQGDPAMRTVAREVLRTRAGDGEAEAMEALRMLMLDPEGPDFERVNAANGLYFAGELPSSGRVEIYLAGKRRELDVWVPWIRHEAVLPGMDDAQRVAFFEAREDSVGGDVHEACRAFSELLARAPARAAQLALRHELAVAQLPVEELREEGERGLRELLSLPDCPLRSRAFQATRELSMGIEDAARQLMTEANRDEPLEFEDAVALLLICEDLARKHGEEDRALAAGVARHALGAFEIGPDGTRYDGRQELFPDG